MFKGVWWRKSGIWLRATSLWVCGDFLFCHLVHCESSRGFILFTRNRGRSCWIKAIWSLRSCYLTRRDHFKGHYVRLVWSRNTSMKQLENYPLFRIRTLMKSTIPTLTLIEIYSRKLIFTTLCSIKPEFASISDVIMHCIIISKELCWALFSLLRIFT